MSRKTVKIPDSDVTARKRNGETDEAGGATITDQLQTSNKTGKHSSVEKLAASRPEFGESPGAHPKSGAFGNPTPEEDTEHPLGSNGSRGLNGRPGGISNKVRKTKGAR